MSDGIHAGLHSTGISTSAGSEVPCRGSRASLRLPVFSDGNGRVADLLENVGQGQGPTLE